MVFKLIIVGESGVGKSNILLRYRSNSFDPFMKNTIGVDFYQIDYSAKNGLKVVWCVGREVTAGDGAALGHGRSGEVQERRQKLLQKRGRVHHRVRREQPELLQGDSVLDGGVRLQVAFAGLEHARPANSRPRKQNRLGQEAQASSQRRAGELR